MAEENTSRNLRQHLEQGFQSLDTGGGEDEDGGLGGTEMGTSWNAQIRV